MTKRIRKAIAFPGCKGHKVEAEFSGGDVTSDGGVLLLRQMDRRLGLLKQVAGMVPDDRDPSRVVHSQLSMVRQRVYGIALGWEDLNDHARLRLDPAVQTAVERDEELASAPTLCRLEHRSGRQAALDIHRALIEQFIASFDTPPDELILDFDATDDPVHGKQEGRFFHGYYDAYCFLPLYVFCGDQLLVAYLRPANRDAARHAWAILSLLVKRLRAAWPRVRIILRGDSGFCRWKMLRWSERHDVGYIVGLAKNDRLKRLAAGAMAQAAAEHEQTGQKARAFTEFDYAAKTWDKPRRVIARIEHDARGANPRFIVTNLTGEAQPLYERVYCARGEMENRIKEQLQLFSDRTSCHAWWPNQFRLLLSALAYVLVESIRRLALHGTELARAQVDTIRLKLFKIGAVILRNTRRVRFLLSSAHPGQALFRLVASRLAPS